MTPREWALTVKLNYCEGACASDALLCVPHGRIEKAIEGAMTESRLSVAQKIDRRGCTCKPGGPLMPYGTQTKVLHFFDCPKSIADGLRR